MNALFLFYSKFIDQLGTENLFRADEDLVSFINNIVGKWNKSLFEKTSRDLRCLGYISD